MFAEKDMLFRKACEIAGIQPTKRQASKYLRRKGTAYARRSDALCAYCHEAVAQYGNACATCAQGLADNEADDSTPPAYVVTTDAF